MIGIGPLNEAEIASTAARVPESLSGAVSDAYASGEYRVHLATVLTKRAMTAAFEAAGAA
jgi:CO/xanthine dehydrogenase FAD-binding subunit